VELHVCYGTFGSPDSHPCKKAYAVLIDAGYEPRVIRTGGCYGTNPLWRRRRALKRATGNYKVPTLFLDDGTIIDGSREIAEWASTHLATAQPHAAESA
jgi:glutaredoxin